MLGHWLDRLERRRMLRVVECLPWAATRLLREVQENMQNRPQRDACTWAWPSNHLISPVLIKWALLHVPDLTKLDLQHLSSLGAKVSERPRPWRHMLYPLNTAQSFKVFHFLVCIAWKSLSTILMTVSLKAPWEHKLHLFNLRCQYQPYLKIRKLSLIMMTWSPLLRTASSRLLRQSSLPVFSFQPKPYLFLEIPCIIPASIYSHLENSRWHPISHSM